MIDFFHGTATAMITPFTKEGAVNFDAFGRMIEYQIAGGTDVLLILGTTGKPATMTEEEKEAVMRFSVEKVKGRAKIVFGSGSNSTAHAIEASKKAEALGADGLLAVTPYYNKCTQNGLVAYYKAIAEATKLPVICYNVPGRTGVNILPETMAKIAEIPNIAGIKEASGNMAQVLETARLIRGKCDLYSGEDALNMPILAAGGTAVISVVSNIAPAGVKELCDAVLSGDLKRANECNDRLIPLSKACFVEVNPIPAKAGMNALGFRAGTPRAPLSEIEEPHRAVLLKAMQDFGLEVKA